MESELQALQNFRVEGLGFRVEGLGLRIEGLKVEGFTSEKGTLSSPGRHAPK